MGTYDTHGEPRRSNRYVPAYGPIDAVLGFGLFYVVVTRATPTIVAIANDVLPGVASSSVRFALAAALWFILTVTLLDQLRRQLTALGLAHHPEVDPDPAKRTPPSEPLALAYLVGVVLAGGIAWLTFDAGIAALISMLPAIATLDVGAVRLSWLVLLVVFFGSYGIATRSLDRLVIGGLRSLLIE
ncbi:hypothetical protein [Halorarius litoreus]|uniref:hypothetical protein n=1 Tax=Halorarius litoreus TaxID=2962676 RepID=UPI0020CF3404|nr:hypothetical protein [Halorarius litoreus]